MAKKHHIGKNGPAPCKAAVRCPIGGEHFDSMEEAEVAYQKIRENDGADDGILQKTPKSEVDNDGLRIPDTVKNEYRVGSPVPVSNEDAANLHTILLKEHQATIQSMEENNLRLEQAVKNGEMSPEDAHAEQLGYMTDSLVTEKRLKDFEAREYAWANQSADNLYRLAGRGKNQLRNAQRKHEFAQKEYLDNPTDENKATMDAAEEKVVAFEGRHNRLVQWADRVAAKEQEQVRDEKYSSKFGMSHSEWENETEKYEFKSYEAGHEQFDAALDSEAEGPGTELYGFTYSPAVVLRRTDPAAYRQGLDQYADARAQEKGVQVEDANDYANEYDDYLDETTTSLSNIGGNRLYGSTIVKRMGDYDTGFNAYANDYNIDTDLLWDRESDYQED